MRNSRKRGIDLEAMVESGAESAYEALQLYKSKISRLRTKNAQDEALVLSAKAAAHMLKNKYESAGIELSSIFVEILEEKNQDISHDIRQMIGQISGEFKPGSSANASFLRDCVRYSVSVGERLYGDVLLHTQLGQCLWISGDHGKAVKHFALGEAPEALWIVLADTFQSAEETPRRDELLTLGVLYFLAYENLRDAHSLMKSQKESEATGGRGAPAQSKQIEFCTYLLQTCLRDATPLFKKLVNAYLEHLRFDPLVESLLMGPIAKKLFGIESAPNMMSMIANMLGAGV